MPALRRVGHKGADLIAPGNTLPSFEAALDAGVDMIEFDVLPERRDGSGALLLAHDYADLARRRETAITLEEGLDHFAGEAYAGIELDVDLKLAGYEARVVDALAERGLLDRALVSTMELSSLAALRAASSELRRGWSVPRLRRNPLRHPVTFVPGLIGLQWLRAVLPGRARRALAEERCHALMVHYALVGTRLVDAVLGAGGELYVWTVDDPRRIAALERLGVTGVITNDPRLFAPA